MRTCLLTVLLLFTIAANAQTAQAPNVNERTTDCSQPPSACEKPVKWLTDKKDCSCFACEYAKPGRQHTVCTSNKDAKLALMKLSHSDGTELASGPVKTFTGKIAMQGNTFVFIDKNGKIWSILNPDLSKPYSGLHVQAKARVNEDQSAVYFESVNKEHYANANANKDTDKDKDKD
jgi:hypothetical protein